MTPPPSKEWMEIGVHPELCVGTVTRALSKVNNAVQNHLKILQKEGQFHQALSLGFRVRLLRSQFSKVQIMYVEQFYITFAI